MYKEMYFEILSFHLTQINCLVSLCSGIKSVTFYFCLIHRTLFSKAIPQKFLSTRIYREVIRFMASLLIPQGTMEPRWGGAHVSSPFERATLQPQSAHVLASPLVDLKSDLVQCIWQAIVYLTSHLFVTTHKCNLLTKAFVAYLSSLAAHSLEDKMYKCWKQMGSCPFCESPWFFYGQELCMPLPLHWNWMLWKAEKRLVCTYPWPS